MFNRFYALVALTLSSAVLHAQNDTTVTISKKDYNDVLKYYFPSKDIRSNNVDIFTDRPHQTETAEIVPYKHFQVESGFSFEVDRSGIIKEENIAYNSLLLKYGIGSGMDLRVNFDYLSNKSYRRDTLINKLNGFSGLSFGGKKFLYKGSVFLPKISLMAEIYLPYFGRKDFRPNYTGGTLRLLCEHELGKNTELEYNFGPDWGGYSANVSYFYAVSLTQKIAGPLSVYGEIYGFFIENGVASANGNFTNDFRCDAGFVYLLQSNLQLDLEGGIGISEISPNYFVSAGVSWRIPN